MPRTPNTYARPGGGYTTALGHGFSTRTPSGYSGYPSMEPSSRDAQAFAAPRQNGLSSTARRPPTQNRALTARAQNTTFGHSGTGYAGSYEKQARQAASIHLGAGASLRAFMAAAALRR